jgi:hypothetical protein
MAPSNKAASGERRRGIYRVIPDHGMTRRHGKSPEHWGINMPKPAHIDNDTWRRMIAYGGDPYLPQQIKVEVLSLWGSEYWTLEEFQTMMKDAFSKVPAEFHAQAIIDFEGGDSESSGHFEIYFYRPSTKEEIEERAQRFIDYAREQQESERQLFNQLKQKYEPGNPGIR